MKIGWIADNFYPDIKRGAEVHDKLLIDEGEKRGHTITKMGFGREKLGKNVDMFIVSNFVDKFSIGEIFSCLAGKRYISLLHDLRAPQFGWYKAFASQALINVYLSPMQRQVIEDLNGKFEHKIYMHPTALPEIYKDYGWKRLPENEMLYAGDYCVEKGYQTLVDYVSGLEDCRIWHFGGGFDKRHPKMMEMGFISQERMPSIYNTFSSLIFLPQYYQVCSRVVGEAFLCKIPNIITNGKDGFTSWDFKMEDYNKVRELLIHGHEKFWDMVEMKQNVRDN